MSEDWIYQKSSFSKRRPDPYPHIDHHIWWHRSNMAQIVLTRPHTEHPLRAFYKDQTGKLVEKQYTCRGIRGRISVIMYKRPVDHPTRWGDLTSTWRPGAVVKTAYSTLEPGWPQRLDKLLGHLGLPPCHGIVEMFGRGRIPPTTPATHMDPYLGD